LRRKLGNLRQVANNDWHEHQRANSVSKQRQRQVGISPDHSWILGGLYYGPIYNIVFSSNTVSSNNENGIYFRGHLPQPSADFDLVASNNRVVANKQKGFYIISAKSNITENSISYNQYGVFYSARAGNVAKKQ
jgi:hypothetical protein